MLRNNEGGVTGCVTGVLQGGGRGVQKVADFALRNTWTAPYTLDNDVLITQKRISYTHVYMVKSHFSDGHKHARFLLKNFFCKPMN